MRKACQAKSSTHSEKREAFGCLPEARDFISERVACGGQSAPEKQRSFLAKVLRVIFTIGVPGDGFRRPEPREEMDHVGGGDGSCAFVDVLRVQHRRAYDIIDVKGGSGCSLHHVRMFETSSIADLEARRVGSLEVILTVYS